MTGFLTALTVALLALAVILEMIAPDAQPGEKRPSKLRYASGMLFLLAGLPAGLLAVLLALKSILLLVVLGLPAALAVLIGLRQMRENKEDRSQDGQETESNL